MDNTVLPQPSPKPKKKFSLKNKYITKREIIIVAVVAVVIFAILCDKPYSGENFSLWKPSLWSATVLPNNAGTMFSIPRIGVSDDDVMQDKVVITDVSSALSVSESDIDIPEELAVNSAKDYILMRINEETDYALGNLPKEIVREPVQILETGRLNMGSGVDAYYFIFQPGGEYSGNKVLEVAIKKGDIMLLASFRSRWMNFDDNFAKAFSVIKSIKITK